MTGTIRTRSQPSVVASHEESEPRRQQCVRPLAALATLAAAP